MIDKEISVAIIEPVGGHGGMDYYDFGLAFGLAKAGLNVDIYTCDETVVPAQTPFTVRHTFRRIFGADAVWIRALRYLLGGFVSIWSTVRKRTVVCHFHLFHVGPLEAATVAMARIARRRIVVTAHDVESFVENLEIPILSRWVYRTADAVIAHNRISCQALVKFLRVSEEKIALIPHGNYLHAVRPSPSEDVCRRQLGISPRSKVILFFGQIKEVKGLELLIEAMPHVVDTYPDATLLIAGKPWKVDFQKYADMIENFGVRENSVTHIRFIDDHDVSLYYGSADVVVLPYKRIYQSGVVLMAMSYGTAVVVSNLPGMLEIVTDEENGFVFQLGVPGSLAKKLCQVLGNDQQRSLVAQQGLSHVRDEYDWERIGRKTAEVYAGSCHGHD